MDTERSSLGGRTDDDHDRRGRRDRAVSEVIGAILVFGLLVGLLAIVQTQAIPSANEDVELSHSTEAQNDMSRLSTALTRTSVTGDQQPVSVKLGTRYPARLVFFNPPPVSGRLASEPAGEIGINNVVALNDETADYFDGDMGNQSTDEEFATGILSYDARYNRLENQPTVRYEHSILYNSFNNSSGGPPEVLVQNGGDVIDGRDISLVLLEENVSTQQVTAASLTSKAVSAPARTVQVEQTGSSNIELSLPTHLPEEVWVQEILVDEIDDPDGNGAPPEAGDLCGDFARTQVNQNNDRYVVDCEYTARPGRSNRLTLIMQENAASGGEVTYDLRMSKVSLKDEPAEPNVTYVTTVSDESQDINNDEVTELTVEARDKYNNPVSGVEVEVSSVPTDGEMLGSTTVTTDEEGRASFTYESPTTGSATDTVQLSLVDPPSNVPPGGGAATFQIAVANAADEAKPDVTGTNLNQRDFQVCNSVSEETIGGGVLPGGATSVVVCDGSFVSYEQTTVTYEMHDNTSSTGTASGLDYATFTVKDSNGNVISTYSRQFSDDYIGSANAYSGRLTTAFLPPTEDAAEIEITVYDESGRASDTETVTP